MAMLPTDASAWLHILNECGVGCADRSAVKTRIGDAYFRETKLFRR